jgi:crotonobetainyl-CoA:carnitine CoA-transferase CaiB-like acyl-CoA transferase
MKKVNPRLVYLSVSGFGRTGPERNRAGYDLLLQGYGGLMGTTGEPDGAPVKAGPSLVDISTGVLGALGVLAALMARDKSGKGQYVDCSLLDGQVMMLNHFATGYFATGRSAERMGSGHQTIVPYQAFQTEDKYILLAVGNDGLWKKMCQGFGWQDLLEVPHFTTNQQRVANREEVVTIMSERLATMHSEDIFKMMDDVGVPCGPINSIEEVVTSPQAIARGMMVDVPHPDIKNLKTPAFPIKLSETPATVRRHPPKLGEHTEEVLLEYGLSLNDIQALQQQGVISTLIKSR